MKKTLDHLRNKVFNLAVGGGIEPPTEQLAIVQYIKWSTLALVLYTTFISDSPPPRQEGMSASFNILQYNCPTDNDTNVIKQSFHYKYYHK